MAVNSTYESRDPGVSLRAELRSRGLTQRAFAQMLGMHPSHLSEFINGKRPFTKQFAEKLEEQLGIPASVWLKSQARADYASAVRGLEKQDAHMEDGLLVEYDEIYDLKVIFKYAGISKKTSAERLDFCRSVLHFGLPSIQKKIIAGYFHKSEKTGLDTRMIATWSVLAMFEASRQPLPSGKFEKEKCDELAEKLSRIFNENYNTLNRVTITLSEYGIKFCVVPKVPHASIDGFSFYNNGVPCIVVTKRFNRIDNLAFAVLHEVGHLKLHLSTNGVGKVNVVNPDLDKLEKDEEQANEYAANALIPEEIWNTQPAVQLNPRVIQARFTRWAKSINKNKWIVLGRASHETNIYMFKSDETREIN
jgi:HTH-type transcriptional regulator / antitoxin HigA